VNKGVILAHQSDIRVARGMTRWSYSTNCDEDGGSGAHSLSSSLARFIGQMHSLPGIQSTKHA
jgi:hypothetical protein